jgi:hypothetical protein
MLLSSSPSNGISLAVFKSRHRNQHDAAMGSALCSHYYSVVSILHCNFLPIRKNHILSQNSTSKAVSAAFACIQLAPWFRNTDTPSHHHSFFIQHLFNSAVVLLIYAMHATDAQATRDAIVAVRSAIAALEAWVWHWHRSAVHQYCKLLDDMATTAVEAMETGVTLTRRVGHSDSDADDGKTWVPSVSLLTSSMVSHAPGPPSPQSPANHDRGRNGKCCYIVSFKC